MIAPRRIMQFIGFMLLLVFAFTNPVHAQGPVGVIPTGTTLEADAFLSAPDIIVDGNVDGDLFAVGESVTVNGNVTGSVFLVANRATIRGKVSGSLYALAANLNLDDTAQIEHSAYISALSLLTARGSTIARDLYTISVGAQLSGSIARTTRAIIGPVEIFRLLMTQAESLKLFSTSMNLAPPNAGTASASLTPPGTACSAPPALAMGAATGFIGKTLECFLNPPQSPPSQENQQTDTAANVRDWASNRAREFVVLALIGLVLVLAFPRSLTEWSLSIPTRPWLTALIGLLVAVNGFILAFLLFLLLIALGILFLQLTLGALTFLTWTLGMTVSAAAFWLFILFLFYISQVVFATWAANWAFKRFAPQTKLHRVIPMLLGVFVFVILSALPVLGAIVSLIASLLGMGGVVLALTDHFVANRSRSSAKAAA